MKPRNLSLHLMKLLSTQVDLEVSGHTLPIIEGLLLNALFENVDLTTKRGRTEREAKCM